MVLQTAIVWIGISRHWKQNGLSAHTWVFAHWLFPFTTTYQITVHMHVVESSTGARARGLPSRRLRTCRSQYAALHTSVSVCWSARSSACWDSTGGCFLAGRAAPAGLDQRLLGRLPAGERAHTVGGCGASGQRAAPAGTRPAAASERGAPAGREYEGQRLPCLLERCLLSASCALPAPSALPDPAYGQAHNCGTRKSLT